MISMVSATVRTTKQRTYNNYTTTAAAAAAVGLYSYEFGHIFHTMHYYTMPSNTTIIDLKYQHGL